MVSIKYKSKTPLSDHRIENRKTVTILSFFTYFGIAVGIVLIMFLKPAGFFIIGITVGFAVFLFKNINSQMTNQSSVNRSKLRRLS